MAAKFIVIEGLEGAGKSTAITLCQAYLKKKNVEFINTREPGGTPVAESLRNLVKAQHAETISPEAELLIMYAARSQLVNNVILPALDNNIWVLGDRHELSSRAYQGGGREIDDRILNSLSDIVLKNLKPNLTIYLDLDPEIGLKRAAIRGELDRIEHEKLSFFQRAREKYLTIAHNDDNIKIVDASQPIAAVHLSITAVLDDFFEQLST